MLQCTICGERFQVPWRSHMTENDAVCDPCFQANLAGDTLRQEPRPALLTLTPQQVEAMRRVAARWRREEEES
jgi:hypothetical protein